MKPIADRINAVFADAGATGWLHARAVHQSAADVDVGGDRPVAIASLYKLPLALALMRMADRGDLELTEQITVTSDARTTGPTGISMLLDDVTMSWQDLAAMMMSISDNAAADAILQRVGLAEVGTTLNALGLAKSRIVGSTADMYRLLHMDTGTADLSTAFDALADTDHSVNPRVYDPLQSSSATAREMTALLSAVWSESAARPSSCRFLQRLMASQIRANRIASGFAFPGVRVAGKTGTIGALRHEAGVVQYDGEIPYAVAVFTQSARAAPIQPRVDAAIGTAARIAIDHLRGLDPFSDLPQVPQVG
jgi:beta-lactamase class A